MSTEREQKSWVQCQECGHVYQLQYQVPDDELFVYERCPVCEIRFGLNLGTNEDDIYLYLNQNVDPRYYTYEH